MPSVTAIIIFISLTIKPWFCSIHFGLGNKFLLTTKHELCPDPVPIICVLILASNARFDLSQGCSSSLGSIITSQGILQGIQLLRGQEGFLKTRFWMGVILILITNCLGWKHRCLCFSRSLPWNEKCEKFENMTPSLWILLQVLAGWGGEAGWNIQVLDLRWEFQSWIFPGIGQKHLTEGLEWRLLLLL